MKKCPTCNRTFTDDALSFCLNDGSQLVSTGAGSDAGSYDPGATIQYNPARDTNPPPPSTPAYTPAPFPAQQPQQPTWTPTPPVGMGGMQGQPPPKKSNKAIWIVGVIAAVVVLGIGGIALVFVLVGMSDSNTNNSNNSNSNTTSNHNANNANDNNSNAVNSNENMNTSKVVVEKDDFSVTRWWVGSNIYGKGEYVNGEYQLTASAAGYVAVYGPNSYLTQNATTRLTAHSVTGVSPPMGFGLTVLSELKGGQLDDMAFLIRTDDNPAYRIVLHRAGKETAIVDWTPASQIRTGTSSNQLEVRTVSSRLEFYINGQLATSVPTTDANENGIAGLYTSGLSPIAFDDLEISK